MPSGDSASRPLTAAARGTARATPTCRTAPRRGARSDAGARAPTPQPRSVTGRSVAMAQGRADGWQRCTGQARTCTAPAASGRFGRADALCTGSTCAAVDSRVHRRRVCALHAAGSRTVATAALRRRRLFRRAARRRTQPPASRCPGTPRCAARSAAPLAPARRQKRERVSWRRARHRRRRAPARTRSDCAPSASLEAPPAASTTYAIGHASNSSRSLGGAAADPGEMNKPPPLHSMWCTSWRQRARTAHA